MEFELGHNETERTFYRKLFIRRYTLLIEKARQKCDLSDDAVATLQSRILSLDWIDNCIVHLQLRLHSCTAKED